VLSSAVRTFFPLCPASAKEKTTCPALDAQQNVVATSSTNMGQKYLKKFGSLCCFSFLRDWLHAGIALSDFLTRKVELEIEVGTEVGPERKVNFANS